VEMNTKDRTVYVMANDIAQDLATGNSASISC
jgi:hypothetical protein